MFCKIINKQEAGYGLIETAIALVIFGIFMSCCLPFILYAQANSKQSEIRTGALMVARRTFEDIRSTPIDLLPTAVGATIVSPVNLASPTLAEQIFTKALGRQYSTKVTFCFAPSICTDTSRTYKVEVFFNDPTKSIYGYQGVQTKFQ